MSRKEASSSAAESLTSFPADFVHFRSRQNRNHSSSPGATREGGPTARLVPGDLSGSHASALRPE